MAVLEKAVPKDRWTRRLVAKTASLQGAFFWLSAFYVVYCARPEDWIPGLYLFPIANRLSGLTRIYSGNKAPRAPIGEETSDCMRQ